MVPFLRTIVPPKITSPYGDRIDPLDQSKRRFHNGIDLVANFEPLYAPLEGDITFGYNEASGNWARINHGEFVTAYAHLSQALTANDHVYENEGFAITGNSGHSTGAHLHFGMQYGDNWVDPTEFVNSLYTQQLASVGLPLAGIIIVASILWFMG